MSKEEKCLLCALQCFTIVFITFVILVAMNVDGEHRRRKRYQKPTEPPDTREREKDPDCQCRDVVVKNETLPKAHIVLEFIYVIVIVVFLKPKNTKRVQNNPFDEIF